MHGSGRNARSFLHVDDVVRAFDLLMRRGKTMDTYNISQPIERSNIDVLKSVLVALGKAKSEAEINSKDERFFQYVENRAFNDKCYRTTSEKLERLGTVS